MQGITEIEATTTPSMNGEAPLPKRQSRGMLPSTWLGRSLRVEYVAVDGGPSTTTATLLDWCSLGVVLNLSGARTVLPWERLALVELIND